jgi:proline dehydrogenase
MSLLDRLIVASLPIVPRPIVGAVSKRYVAGETLASALDVVRRLNQGGVMATLDVLGENVTRPEEAAQAVQAYQEALHAIARDRLDSNVSLKPTQFGLKLDRDLCRRNIRAVVETARQLGNFVRIDMEDSSCTTDTLELYAALREEFDNVGVVIQAYLRRSVADVRALAGRPTNLRLCKGIYVEPRRIAYRDPELINRNYDLLLGEMLEAGVYVGIATHDERLVFEAERRIDALRLAPHQYEFQMLLGVDPELGRLILARGHRLRLYVPYGAHWYAYCVRRLKENPRIARHVLTNLVRRSSGPWLPSRPEDAPAPRGTPRPAAAARRP